MIFHFSITTMSRYYFNSHFVEQQYVSVYWFVQKNIVCPAFIFTKSNIFLMKCTTVILKCGTRNDIDGIFWLRYSTKNIVWTSWVCVSFKILFLMFSFIFVIYHFLNVVIFKSTVPTANPRSIKRLSVNHIENSPS